MYVCICRQITDKQIRAECASGAASLKEVRARLGVASDCGRCSKHTRELLAEISAANLCNAANAA